MPCLGAARGVCRQPAVHGGVGRQAGPLPRLLQGLHPWWVAGCGWTRVGGRIVRAGCGPEGSAQADEACSRCCGASALCICPAVGDNGGWSACADQVHHHFVLPDISPYDNLLPSLPPPPDPTWRTHPPTMTALSATATSLGAKVRPAACAATGTCLPGSEIMPGAGAGAGSGPTAGQAALITPGAALAAIPGEAWAMAPGPRLMLLVQG